jgi:putative hemolysin
MDEPGSQLILLILLIALNALFSAATVAIISIPQTRLDQLIEAGDARARRVRDLAEESSRSMATLQIIVTWLGYLAAAVAALGFSEGFAQALLDIPIGFSADSARAAAVITVTIVVSFIMLVLGDQVPRSIAVRHSERIALFAAYPLYILTRLLSPIARVLIAASNLIARPLGGRAHSTMPIVTEEEIKRLVDAGQEGGVLEEDEKKMIYSIFEIGDMVAREVMVPRIDIIAVEVNTPLLDAADTIIQHGYSRIPVYDATIDHITGIVYAKDLLKVLRQRGRSGSRNTSLKSIVRPAYFVPETKKADVLLEELQQRKVHMAIVIDEYGGTAGLVTIEDLVEEIVGEIQDEYDLSEEPMVKALPGGAYELDPRILLDDVNDLLDTQLADDESDTLGGFIYNQLGKVPHSGEEIRVDNVSLKILKVHDRRIGRVLVQRDVPAPPPDQPNGSDTQTLANESAS